jgi:two-component system sensor histidine kinase RpfC
MKEALNNTAVPIPNSALPTVLVVDDNEPTALALGKIFSAKGFNPVVVHRGGDALSYAEGHSIDAAVVDLHLPDLSGLVVTQKLRERLGVQMPIIILSGDTSMEMLNALRHVGATYFFSKPVNSKQLVERLKQSLMADSTH